MWAVRLWGGLIRYFCCFCCICMVACFVVPAPTGDGAASLKTLPLLLAADTPQSLPTAPTAENDVLTTEHGEEGTSHLSGSSADPSLTDFQHFVQQRESCAGKVLLDLRPVAHYRREHLVGATSIPADELEARLLELPPPFAKPVTIVGNEEELRSARELLTRKGWRIDVETACVDGWRAETEVGSRSAQAWRANDFLEFCMERYLLPFISERGGEMSGPALDLGCGSGRDTVYMAQRLPPGARVVGVDNHSYALERGARLAEQWVDVAHGSGHGTNRRNGVNIVDEGRSSILGDERRSCKWLLTDLRKPGSLEGLKADVIHGHRFKCEQLLPLLRDQVLLPGGFFIWSTFLDTGIEKNYVPPWRPSRMLRPGELAHIFSGDDFEILQDEAGELPTRGSTVPANFFACRKRLGIRPPSL